ncbi:MAG: nucleotidyltransferase family protein [Deltaproteobacteria bacterium]|jgi:D-glycero-alpha-D-manno-heptose 1-phosphate guanylyltransferase|nr:nucleotidyltransferase family protein [Deltaproteobacteria bacterium]MCL5879547.1 nucleotidyltransferase family protein [Deltaproteobacteria bacterium]MDA8305074.1 nucleotidyltransferase family protein [Deltaproteobacteria bacterium]
MIKQAIILAGGLGTRLKAVIKDIPKPMADIDGKPFLEYLLRFLSAQGIEEVIISCGYKHEVIENYFKGRFGGLKIYYSIESEPLGTGGAVKKALEFINAGNKNADNKKYEDILILNGDTFFNISLKELYGFHKAKNSDLTLALKALKNFDRYGTVKIDYNNKIKGFEEKKPQKEGFINGGIYLLSVNLINLLLSSKLNLSAVFSFEKDFLEVYYNYKDKDIKKGFGLYGLPFDENSYFIDIGIPSDYESAKKELKNQLK